MDKREEKKWSVNPHATSDRTAWVFGDSFTGALKPYFMATFKEIRFFSPGGFYSAVASDLPKPDMMIWVMVERNFVMAE